MSYGTEMKHLSVQLALSWAVQGTYYVYHYFHTYS